MLGPKRMLDRDGDVGQVALSVLVPAGVGF